MSFQFRSLDSNQFTPLFALDEAARADRGARLVVADSKPGYPCRLTLQDAEVGEDVLLLPYVHHDVDSPYRGSGPIYVRNRPSATPAIGEVPEVFRSRLTSVRAYDSRSMMVTATVAAGTDLDAVIREFFANQDVAYIHVHFAKPGCFGALVERAR